MNPFPEAGSALEGKCDAAEKAKPAPGYGTGRLSSSVFVRGKPSVVAGEIPGAVGSVTALALLNAGFVGCGAVFSVELDSRRGALAIGPGFLSEGVH